MPVLVDSTNPDDANAADSGRPLDEPETDAIEEPDTQGGGLFDDSTSTSEGPTEGIGDRQTTGTTLDEIAAGGFPASGQPAGPAALPSAPQAAVDAAYQAGVETAKAKAEVDTGIKLAEEAKAKELEDASVQAKLDEIDRNDLEDQHKEALSRATQEMEAAQLEAKNFTFHDRWEHASTGSKLLAVLFAGIGGGTSVQSGKPDAVWAEMNAADERDFARQRHKLMQTEKFADWKRKGVTDMEGRFGKEMADLRLNQSERLQHMGDYAKAQYLRSGKTKEEAENNVLVQSLYQKASETRAASMMSLYKIQMAKAAKKKSAGILGTPEQAAVIRELKEKNVPDSTIFRDPRLRGANPTFVGKEIAMSNTSQASVNGLGQQRAGKSDANLNGMDEGLKVLEANQKDLTPKVLTLVQDNQRALEAAKHRGPFSNLVLGKLGVPRGKYDGLTANQAKAYRGYEQALQHGSEVQIAQGEGTQEKWESRYGLDPSMTQEQIDQNIKSMRKYQKETRALVPHARQNRPGAETPQDAAQASPAKGDIAEGSTSTSGGKPIVYRGGAWQLQ